MIQTVDGHRFYPQQLQVLKANTEYIIVTGGAGTVKTSACILRLFRQCMEFPAPYMVLMATYTVLQTVFIREWKRMIPSRYFRVRLGDDPTIFIEGGAEIMLRYADHVNAPERVRGASIAGYYISQAELISRDDLFPELEKRTRSYPKLLKMIDANGGNPGRDAYSRFVNPDSTTYVGRGMTCTQRGDVTIYAGDNATHIHVVTTLETSVYSAKQLAEFERTDTEITHRRMMLGEWVADEGLVYTDFSRHTHTTEFEANPSWEWYRGIDFGYENPFCCLWIGVDSDFRLWVYDELYVRKQQFDSLVPEILGRHTELPIRATICDPSQAQIFNLFSQQMSGNAVYPARNRVQPGIAEVRRLLNRRDENGQPFLVIHPRCFSVILEIERYEMARGAGNRATEEPVKLNDHAMDALRYVAYTTREVFGRKL